jgi:quercetin dioxygenase-like cupin family protein
VGVTALTAGGFKPAGSLARDRHDWGVFAQVSGPRDGLAGIVAIEATFLPGKCHDFHLHPGQEEVIYVLEGTIEQWLVDEKRVLSAGDSVVIPESAVHATFNDSETPARILAILSPAVGDDGYGVEDVSGEAPWAGLR